LRKPSVVRFTGIMPVLSSGFHCSFIAEILLTPQRYFIKVLHYVNVWILDFMPIDFLPYSQLPCPNPFLSYLPRGPHPPSQSSWMVIKGVKSSSPLPTNAGVLGSDLRKIGIQIFVCYREKTTKGEGKISWQS
jgi:hypothetical protein